MVDLQFVYSTLERAGLSGIAKGEAADPDFDSGFGLTVSQATKPSVESAALQEFVHVLDVNRG